MRLQELLDGLHVPDERPSVQQPEKRCACPAYVPDMRNPDGHGFRCAGCGWGSDG